MVGDMAMLPELARTLWYVLWHRLHLFTVCIGLLSFSCSRGPDGNLTSHCFSLYQLGGKHIASDLSTIFLSTC